MDNDHESSAATQAPVAFRIVDLDIQEWNAVLEAFVTLVESERLLFGGGGPDSVWSGWVTGASPDNRPLPPDRLNPIRDWLARTPQVVRYYVGEPMTDEEVDAMCEADPSYPESRLR